MTRGIYAAAAAMMSQMLKQDALANNLSNVDTVGFKADRVAFVSFPDVLQAQVSQPESENRSVMQAPSSLTVPEATVDLSSGALRQTGNPLDVALPEGVFLTVDTPRGARYTRQGNLSIGADGTLESAEGLNVLGEAGPIRVRGKSIQIKDTGEVIADGATMDRLKLIQITDSRQLRKEGEGLFVAVQPAPALAAQVKPGYLELSNVNPMRTLVDMITTMRAYEAAQRSIQLQDETLAQALEVMRAA